MVVFFDLTAAMMRERFVRGMRLQPVMSKVF
jgi:hypothetical protein